MRAVLDTNVIISATLIRGGNEDHIIRAWQRGAFELVLSPQILEEMGRALFYEKLRRFRWMTEEEIALLTGDKTHFGRYYGKRLAGGSSSHRPSTCGSIGRDNRRSLVANAFPHGPPLPPLRVAFGP